MNSIFVAMVLSLTVSTATVMGIVSAYGIITGILHAFAYRQTKRSHPALVVGESHAGGD